MRNLENGTGQSTMKHASLIEEQTFEEEKLNELNPSLKDTVNI